MRIFFFILTAVFMAATLATLLVGVAGMGKGGPFNEKYGNKLMQLRVLLQGLAIACFVLGLVS